MAKFCSQCGKPLADGEVCSCSASMAESKNAPVINLQAAKGVVENMKNRMGIGAPELNKGDAFEKDKNIIPDCVNANEGEIPVKQYQVATLQSRIMGIPYAKASGKMQVTNKRVIFRAPGRSIAGRTTLQHEFAIDELAGLEARREYVFNPGDLLIGLIVAVFGGVVINTLLNAICKSSINEAQMALPIILALLFGAAGCVPFFMMKKQWLLKLLCLGGGLLPLFTFGSTASQIGQYKDEGFTEFMGGFLTFLGIVVVIIALFTLLIYAIKPNLVLVIKTKSASEAIDIRRRKVSLFNGSEEEHTGYAEVLPADDAERCIREIDAMINDIQKLGDFGIEKWKA